jgi:aminoglycoside N3'-acetyltransferase
MGQLRFGRFLQLQDLLLPLGVGFAQCTHVGTAELLHVLFDLVGPQLFGQQGGAFALALGVEPVDGDGQQEQQTEEFHTYRVS